MSRLMVTALAATLLALVAQKSGSSSDLGRVAVAADAPAPFPRRPEDWPGRGVIRVFDWMAAQREQFWRERADRQRSVVFAGDSLTANWRTLPRDLAGERVANRGLGGDVSRGLLLRFDEDVLSLDPRAIVILVGTNDLTARHYPPPSFTRRRSTTRITTRRIRCATIITATDRAATSSWRKCGEAVAAR